MSVSVHSKLENLKKIRSFTINVIKDLTVEQLNKVPEGYNNNIIWNVAHLVAAQESISYLKSGQPVTVPEDFFNAYRSGTRPVKDLTAEEIAEIKGLLLSSVDRLESDYQQHKFDNYIPWTPRYEIEIGNIEAMIDFLPFHEGMHLGCIMALKRLV